MNYRQLTITAATLFLASTCFASNQSQVLGAGKRTSVTTEDFMLDLERIPKEKQPEFLTDPARIEKALASIARTKTYAAIARQQELAKTEEFRSRLKAEEDRILSKMLLAKAATEIKLPDLQGRAKELYAAFPEQSTEPEQVRASHIMVSLRGRSPEDALAKITALREEVLKDPTKFGDIAAAKSEDDSARQNRGEMGLLPRGRLAPEVEATLFAMKSIGEVSEPILGPTGYHIVQVHEIVPSRRKPFEDVKTEYLARAERAFVEAELFKLQEQWLKEENFKFNEKAIESLIQRSRGQTLPPDGKAVAPRATQ